MKMKKNLGERERTFEHIRDFFYRTGINVRPAQGRRDEMKLGWQREDFGTSLW